jgi:predicted transcriptional regulator
MPRRGRGIAVALAKDLMTEDVRAVSPEDTLATVKNVFLKHKISKLPVVSGDSVVGMITEAELADSFLKLRAPVNTVSAKEVMSPRLVTVAPDDTAEEVSRVMLRSKAAYVIVADADGMMGIITKTDLINHFVSAYSGRARVSEIMEKNVKTIHPFHSVFRAVKDMESLGIDRLVVVDPNPVGVVSAKDAAFSTFGLFPKKLVWAREKEKGSGKATRSVKMRALTVSDVMRDEVVSIPSKSDAAAAARLMLSKGVGSVVVMDAGKLKGIITKTDVVRFMASRS